MVDFERLAHRASDHLLHGAYGEWSIAGDFGGPLARSNHELIVGNNLVYESHLARAGRVDRIGEVHDLSGVGGTDGFDEAAEDPVGGQITDPRGRHTQAGPLRG